MKRKRTRTPHDKSLHLAVAMLIEIVRQIAIEQGTRDCSGLKWAEETCKALSEINSLVKPEWRNK